jgi:nitrogen fixation protein
MAVNINIPSQVSQTITDGVTDKAPSEDAVHDALALKADTSDLGNYVPYTGATTDVDLGTYNITADHINLNVSPSGAGFVVGSTQWNNTIGSSETLLKGGNVTLKNGVDLVARVVNKVTPNTTLTKAAYQAVRVSGAQGGRLAIALAQANNDNNSADTIGLVTETIATNQEGFIITVGQIENINTTGSLQGETWTDGDVLYLSPTVAGKLTNIKPTGATGHIVVIGYVEYAHANNGKIYVKVMNGWELDELHNVSISSVANNDLLQYDSVTSLWKNESLSTAGIQPTLTSGTNIKTINGNTLLGSGDLVISGGGGITVGTTAVASGTIGRIFFEGTGNVVQQSASLFWDNTNSRLGVGATPSTTVRLDVRAQGALSTDIAFRVRNSADTLNPFQITGDGKTKMQGSIYYAEFDPSNGLFIGNNFGNMLNFTGILQGTSYFNNGADGKLAVGKTTANYRLDVLNSTTNPFIPMRVGTLNGTNDGKVGIAFTTTWTGGQFGNVGGVLFMNHQFVGPTQSVQHCRFDFALNSLNTAPVTKASITAKSNILLGTPTEDLADSHTIYIPNGTAPTANLAGGGKLYVEGGALKYRGSSGTITTVAPA